LFSYDGRATKWTDEAGNVTRITQVDGLGRPTKVCEVTSTGLTGSGSPASCGLDIGGTGYLTTYSYSGATTTVTQGGQTRVFHTDWLGRPTSVQEPESGTTTYTYMKNSTGLIVTRTRPEANQTGSSTTTTTTQYDVLGRVVSISYSDGTPTRYYNYDTPAGWSNFTQTNLKGRLSRMGAYYSSSGAESTFSYDAVGRVIEEAECLPS
jgi:YD repeat-containing protein